MSYVDLSIEKFGGLNLVDDPLDVGFAGATDLMDVEFTEHGALRSRVGTRSLANQSGAYIALTRMGSFFAAVRNNTGSIIIDKCTPGVASSTTGFAADRVSTPAKLSTPTSTALYLATWGVAPAGVSCRKWDGTTLSTVTGKPRYVGVTAESDRLIMAGFLAAADSPTGADGSLSTAFFSDPASPAVFGADNFVDLGSGDGEEIRGIVTWSTYTYIFKDSAVYVFYGEGTLGDGTPEFQFNRIPLPEPLVVDAVRLLGPEDGGLAPGPDGVYFLTLGGLYRIAGSNPPVKVHTPVEPLFRLQGTSWTQAWGGGAGTGVLSFNGDRMYLAYDDGSKGNVTLVWDRTLDVWTAWSLPISTRPIVFPWTTGDPQAIFGTYTLPSATNDLITLYPLYSRTTASGTTGVTWSYTSGLYAPAGHERAVIRESEVFGVGGASLQVAVDSSNFDTGSALTLGTAPAIAGARQRIARRGTYFQHKLSNTVNVASASTGSNPRAGYDAISSVVHRVRDHEENK